MTRDFARRLWHLRPPAEKPLRDELLSIERLEERALALAASFTVDPHPRRRARNILPRFEENVRVLRTAYRTLADDVRTGQFVVTAAEWLLDNFPLVAEEVPPEVVPAPHLILEEPGEHQALLAGGFHHLAVVPQARVDEEVVEHRRQRLGRRQIHGRGRGDLRVVR